MTSRGVNPRGAALFREHVFAGTLTAVLMAVGDVIQGATRQSFPWLSVVSAALFVIGFYVLFGFAFGALSAFLVTALQRSAFAPGDLTRLGTYTRPNPRLFAHVTLVAGAIATYLLTAPNVIHFFVERYHQPVLAYLAAALGSLALFGALVALLAHASRLARRLPRSRAFSLLGALLILGTFAAIASAILVRRFRGIVAALDFAPYLFLVIGLVIFGALIVIIRRRRLPVPPAWVSALVTIAALCGAGAAYGDSNSTRNAAERRTVFGGDALRLFGRLTDRDGDGHSFAFGGHDCDDTREDVYPGALDEVGDGVDADCFAGDGSPDLPQTRVPEPTTLPAGAAAKPNVLFVLVDALRPDHLSGNGYARPTSPKIDAFAESAVVFDAVAQSTRSVRSIPAMFTGLYPSQIAYGDEFHFPSLQDENVTLAELLTENGYETIAISGTNYFTRVGGFWQGFTDISQGRTWNGVRNWAANTALRTLAQRKADTPWFLALHLFNVHAPYLHDGVASRFGSTRMDKYDTEIQLMDALFGRLLEKLEEVGMNDNTIVVLTSDHGEGFGEHGQFGHSETLYDEELKSVLMIRAPGFAPRRVPGTAGLFDLMPTLLDLCRVPITRPVAGTTLVPAMSRGAVEDRLLIAEVLPDGRYPFDQKSIRRGDLKLIWWVREGSVQLFDLSVDPNEEDDLSDQRPEETRELLGLLRAWTGAARGQHRREEILARGRLSRVPEIQHRLDARYPEFTVLGYDLPSTEVSPGDRLPMTFYYQVNRRTDENYKFWIDMVGPPGYRTVPEFHARHYPLHGTHPTTDWEAGDILRDEFEIVVPRDIRRGTTFRIDFSVRSERGRLAEIRGQANRRIDLGGVRIK